jgi:hypothetical protein
MSRRQLTPPHNEVQNVFFHTLTPPTLIPLFEHHRRFV